MADEFKTVFDLPHIQFDGCPACAVSHMFNGILAVGLRGTPSADRLAMRCAAGGIAAAALVLAGNDKTKARDTLTKIGELATLELNNLREIETPDLGHGAHN